MFTTLWITLFISWKYTYKKLLEVCSEIVYNY